jgi:L,D-peptidoglycan transpeptidase YkuD (ErfK/YbiS/YcfS/YnhG family)
MLFAPLLAAAALACAPNLANGLPAAAPGEQLLTVEAATARTTHATLRTWRRAGECWVAVGRGYPARVGRNGLSANRREGDGTTPAGTFRLGATMYGTARNPGVRFGYRRLRCGDWWDEDPASPTYNSFQHVRCGVQPPFKGDSEGMWQQPRAYSHLAVIEFNMRPVVPGRGSGIFLHAQTGGPTNGCISLRRADLVRVLRWLRPDAQPRFVIGTTAQLSRSG